MFKDMKIAKETIFLLLSSVVVISLNEQISKICDILKTKGYFAGKNIGKIMITPLIEAVFDEETLLKFTDNPEVFSFVRCLRENFSDESLNNLYYNLIFLKIEFKNFILSNFFSHDPIEARYDAKNNHIFLDYDCDKSTIYHELFHFASSVRGENVLYSGFKQYYQKKFIYLGEGLNEGYTELLTNRYFGEDETASEAYNLMRVLAKKVETLVGQKSMENLYLSANLQGLIIELEKYATKDEIMRFIINCDYVLKYYNCYIKTMNGCFLNILTEIYYFLFRCYSFKRKNEYLNGFSSKEEMTEEVLQYVEKLLKDINCKYNLIELDSDIFQKEYNAIFGEKQHLFILK